MGSFDELGPLKCGSSLLRNHAPPSPFSRWTLQALPLPSAPRLAMIPVASHLELDPLKPWRLGSLALVNINPSSDAGLVKLMRDIFFFLFYRTFLFEPTLCVNCRCRPALFASMMMIRWDWMAVAPTRNKAATGEIPSRQLSRS